MRYLAVLLLLVSPCLVFSAGCGQSSPKPKAGVVDTTDPSKIVIPDSMKKGPGGKAAPAPGGQK